MSFGRMIMSVAFQLTLLRISRLSKHSQIMDCAKPSIDLVFGFAEACKIGISFPMTKDSALEKQPFALTGNPVLMALTGPKQSQKSCCLPRRMIVEAGQ